MCQCVEERDTAASYLCDACKASALLKYTQYSSAAPPPPPPPPPSFLLLCAPPPLPHWRPRTVMAVRGRQWLPSLPPLSQIANRPNSSSGSKFSKSPASRWRNWSSAYPILHTVLVWAAGGTAGNASAVVMGAVIRRRRSSSSPIAQATSMVALPCHAPWACYATLLPLAPTRRWGHYTHVP